MEHTLFRLRIEDYRHKAEQIADGKRESRAVCAEVEHLDKEYLHPYFHRVCDDVEHSREFRVVVRSDKSREHDSDHKDRIRRHIHEYILVGLVDERLRKQRRERARYKRRDDSKHAGYRRTDDQCARKHLVRLLDVSLSEQVADSDRSARRKRKAGDLYYIQNGHDERVRRERIRAYHVADDDAVKQRAELHRKYHQHGRQQILVEFFVNEFRVSFHQMSVLSKKLRLASEFIACSRYLSSVIGHL